MIKNLTSILSKWSDSGVIDVSAIFYLALINITISLVVLSLTHKTSTGKRTTLISTGVIVSSILMAILQPPYTIPTSHQDKEYFLLGQSPSDKRNYSTQVEFLQETYLWKNKEVWQRARTFLSLFPSRPLLENFTKRIKNTREQSKHKQIDEGILLRLMKESFVETSVASFEMLLDRYIQEYKKVSPLHHKQSRFSTEHHLLISQREISATKIAFIKEHYRWKNDDIMKLTFYLLSRFPVQFLSDNSFIRRLDIKTTKRNKTVDETILRQAMAEHFLSITKKTFAKIAERHFSTFP